MCLGGLGSRAMVGGAGWFNCAFCAFLGVFDPKGCVY